MHAFKSEAMQRHATLLQKAASKEPILFLRAGRPKWVLMSMEEYDRLRGRVGRGGAIVELPDLVADQIEMLADLEDQTTG
jgi:prevent-host-death family protein